MIIGGKMQVGDLTAFINYIVQIMGSLTMLSIVFLNWARAVASFRRVREVLEEEIDLTMHYIRKEKLRMEIYHLKMCRSDIIRTVKKMSCRI